MLVILNGSKTIDKKILRRKVFTTLNEKRIDNYSYSYQNDVLEILDSNGIVVYRPFSNIDQTISLDVLPAIETLLTNEDGKLIKEQFLEFERKNFSGLSDEKYYYNQKFLDFLYEMGYSKTSNFDLPYGEANFCANINFGSDYYRSDYEELIKNYENREDEYYVICGTIGKYVINKLQNDLGLNNVKVINITRNPSVTRIIHEKPKGYYDLAENYGLDYESDLSDMFVSTLNNYWLKKLDYVDTFKYEDILTNGYFEFLGKKIYLPKTHNNYNNLITNFEKNHSLSNINNEEVLNMNHMQTHLHDFFLSQDNYREINKEPYFLKNIPNNLFEELGYNVLNLEEVISK